MPKAIYIPNGLAKVHPGLEPALKSIQAALDALTPSKATSTPAAVGSTPVNPPASSETWREDNVRPALGQTLFTLSATPSALALQTIINDASLIRGVDFTVAGNNVQLLSGLGYSLTPTDIVQFRYPET